MAGSHWRICAAMFVYMELLVSGAREDIFQHDFALTTGLPSEIPTNDVKEVQHMIQQRLNMPEEECPEVPEEVSKPSVSQDMAFFDALLDRVVDVADITLDGAEVLGGNDEEQEETEESAMDSLIAAFEAFEDVMDIHGYATLSNHTREAAFTEARTKLVQKSSDFTPEDVAVAARVVDAHGSFMSAQKLCPQIPDQEDVALSEEAKAQPGVLNFEEAATISNRTLQWAAKVIDMEAKCDGFRDLVKANWDEYGKKVLAFEQAHGQTWYSDFNGFAGNATPAFNYGQSTFDILTKMKVTPRAMLNILSERLPSVLGADCLKTEEVCKLQQTSQSQSVNAPSEAEMRELQLATHMLLQDYKKVCRVSAMGMLIEATLKSYTVADVTAGCHSPWFRPMLCGDHHLWDTQEIIDTASHLSHRVDQADQAVNIVDNILNPADGILSRLKAGLAEEFYDQLKEMMYKRYGDKVEVILSWYNWFAGWLAYGNYIWDVLGKVWRGFSAVSSLGLSEATPSSGDILNYFIETSPWALKKSMIYYKESHQAPNCKKLAADESELPDLQ